jgi:hypothetical protein
MTPKMSDTMGLLSKTARKLGLVKLKFTTISILTGDYLAFKTLSSQFKVTNYEMFRMLMTYFIEGMQCDYRKENEDLRKNLAGMYVIVWEYAKKN